MERRFESAGQRTTIDGVEQKHPPESNGRGLMLSETLLVRTGASREIGTGHAMRCLALGQGWQDAGGRATFAMAIKSPDIEARFKSEGIEVVNIQQASGGKENAVQTAAVANQHNAQWIVLDGYQFGRQRHG